jgi:DNA-binding SARP family transcriptional activator
MMKRDSELRILLFGGLRLQKQGQEPITVPAQLPGMLLALLALRSDRPYLREELVERLWPEHDPERARQLLRNVLHTLRGLLDQPHLKIKDVLLTTRTTVGLDTARICIDLGIFEAALAAAERSQSMPERARHMQEAVSVYQGELLPGFYLEDIVQAQERASQLYERALRELLIACEQMGEWEQAAELARQAIEHNPLLEEAHLVLMRCYAAFGHPSNVLRQYQELERVLKEELDETPSEEMRCLMETLRRNARSVSVQQTEGIVSSVPLATAEPASPQASIIEVADLHPVPQVHWRSQLPAPSPSGMTAPSHQRWSLAAAGLAALVLLSIWMTGYRKPWDAMKPHHSFQHPAGVPLLSSPSALPALLTHPPVTTPDPPAGPDGAENLASLFRNPLSDLPGVARSAPHADRISPFSNLPAPSFRQASGNLNAPPAVEREARQLWVRQYLSLPDERDSEPTAMTTDREGNIYITGFVDTTNNDADFLTLKYSPDGRLLWHRRYNGPSNDVDRARSIAVDREGNVYVTGESDNGKGNGPTHLPGTDYATIKYGPDGEPSPTWPDEGFGVGVRRYNGPDDSEDRPVKVCVNAQGDVYVTGYSMAIRATNQGIKACREWATVKYDAHGIRKWVQRESALGRNTGPLETEPTDMILAPDGDILITGNVQQDLHGVVNCDIETRIYSSDGLTLWSSRYGRANNTEEMATKIAMDGNGAVYVTGITYSMAGGHPDYQTKDLLIIKYEPMRSATEKWVRLFDHEHLADASAALAVDRAGNLYIGGESDTWAHDLDASMLKYDTNGDLKWSHFQNGRGNYADGVAGVALDSAGDVIFAGSTYDGNPGAGGTDWDYFTYKYDADGRPIWKAIFDGNGLGDTAVALAVDRNDFVIVTGRSDHGHIFSITTIKYAP